VPLGGERGREPGMAVLGSRERGKKGRRWREKRKREKEKGEKKRKKGKRNGEKRERERKERASAVRRRPRPRSATRGMRGPGKGGARTARWHSVRGGELLGSLRGAAGGTAASWNVCAGVCVGEQRRPGVSARGRAGHVAWRAYMR